jgi:dihydrodipicolinate synthase/N-acetylneuraminate lyase
VSSTFCCSITPFAPGGALDEAAARAHFERLCAAGVGVYAGGSSPGEQYSLLPEEVERLLRAAVEVCKGRVAVRAMGVEARHAREMCAFAALAARCGVDALQIYSPDVGHGAIPCAAELETYFRTVLGSTELPCVLSSHFLGGYVLPEELIERLIADHPHVVGLNVSTNDLAYLARVLERVAGRVEVHMGGPLHALSALALGASGFLSAEANIAPRLARALVDAWDARDLEGAARAYARLMALYCTRPVSGAGASVRWLKAALEHLGLPGGALRDPNLPLPREERERIGQRLERLRVREVL